MFVGDFFVFRKLEEKLCVSWALPLVECVAVWALKLPEFSAPLRSLQNRSPPDFLQRTPTYSKPTRHKVFLLIYWNPNESATNICHSPIISNSFFFYVSSYYSFNFLIRFIRPHNFQKVVCCYDLKLICLIIFMQHLKECFIAHCFPQFIQE